MFRLILIAVWVTFQTHLAVSEDVDECLLVTSPWKDMSFTEMAEYDGYETESHSVTTDDGYILGVYRLPLQDNCTANRNKVPIIFMHGLYLTGDDCIIPGSGAAHCYIYADSCHDVWVPNVRGNRYSRNHKTLDPDNDSEFWNFSFDDMALYDLPAVIDYVLEQTGQTQVAYVSHGQGAAMLLLLCAKKPEYNDKVTIGIGMSTTAWLNNSRSSVVDLQGSSELGNATLEETNMEVLSYHDGVNGSTIECGNVGNVSYTVCSLFNYTDLSYNTYQISDDILPIIVSHVPGGTSLKNLNRWVQIKNNGFTEYDYGTSGNVEAYNSTTPPEFDLSLVTMKWIFIGSTNDYVSDPKDLVTLYSNLSNSSIYILPNEVFGHLDYVYGKDIPTFITSVIQSALKCGSYECE